MTESQSPNKNQEVNPEDALMDLENALKGGDDDGRGNNVVSIGTKKPPSMSEVRFAVARSSGILNPKNVNGNNGNYNNGNGYKAESNPEQELKEKINELSKKDKHLADFLMGILKGKKYGENKEETTDVVLYQINNLISEKFIYDEGKFNEIFIAGSKNIFGLDQQDFNTLKHLIKISDLFKPKNSDVKEKVGDVNDGVETDQKPNPIDEGISNNKEQVIELDGFSVGDMVFIRGDIHSGLVKIVKIESPYLYYGDNKKAESRDLLKVNTVDFLPDFGPDGISLNIFANYFIKKLFGMKDEGKNPSEWARMFVTFMNKLSKCNDKQEAYKLISNKRNGTSHPFDSVQEKKLIDIIEKTEYFDNKNKDNVVSDGNKKEEGEDVINSDFNNGDNSVPVGSPISGFPDLFDNNSAGSPPTPPDEPPQDIKFENNDDELNQKIEELKRKDSAIGGFVESIKGKYKPSVLLRVVLSLLNILNLSEQGHLKGKSPIDFLDSEGLEDNDIQTIYDIFLLDPDTNTGQEVELSEEDFDALCNNIWYKIRNLDYVFVQKTAEKFNISKEQVKKVFDKLVEEGFLSVNKSNPEMYFMKNDEGSDNSGSRTEMTGEEKKNKIKDIFNKFAEIIQPNFSSLNEEQKKILQSANNLPDIGDINDIKDFLTECIDNRIITKDQYFHLLNIYDESYNDERKRRESGRFNVDDVNKIDLNSSPISGFPSFPPPPLTKTESIKEEDEVRESSDGTVIGVNEFDLGNKVSADGIVGYIVAFRKDLNGEWLCQISDKEFPISKISLYSAEQEEQPEEISTPVENTLSDEEDNHNINISELFSKVNKRAEKLRVSDDDLNKTDKILEKINSYNEEQNKEEEVARNELKIAEDEYVRQVILHRKTILDKKNKIGKIMHNLKGSFGFDKKILEKDKSTAFKDAEEKYNRAKRKIADFVLFNDFKIKRDKQGIKGQEVVLGSGKVKAEGEFSGIKYVNNGLVKEAEKNYQSLNQKITESLPEEFKAKSIFNKSLILLQKMPRWKKIAISSAIVATPFGVAGGISAGLTYGVWRFSKGMVGGSIGQGFGYIFDKSRKYLREKDLEKVKSKSAEDFSIENFDEKERDLINYLKSIDDSKKRDLLYKAGINFASGVGINMLENTDYVNSLKTDLKDSVLGRVGKIGVSDYQEPVNKTNTTAPYDPKGPIGNQDRPPVSESQPIKPNQADVPNKANPTPQNTAGQNRVRFVVEDDEPAKPQPKPEKLDTTNTTRLKITKSSTVKDGADSIPNKTVNTVKIATSAEQKAGLAGAEYSADNSVKDVEDTNDYGKIGGPSKSTLGSVSYNDPYEETYTNENTDNTGLEKETYSDVPDESGDNIGLDNKSENSEISDESGDSSMKPESRPPIRKVDTEEELLGEDYPKGEKISPIKSDIKVEKPLIATYDGSKIVGSTPLENETAIPFNNGSSKESVLVDDKLNYIKYRGTEIAELNSKGEIILDDKYQFDKDFADARRAYNIALEQADSNQQAKFFEGLGDKKIDYRAPLAYKGGNVNLIRTGNDVYMYLNGKRLGEIKFDPNQNKIDMIYNKSLGKSGILRVNNWDESFKDISKLIANRNKQDQNFLVFLLKDINKK